MSKKGKKIYIGILYNQLKVSLVFIVVLAIIFGVCKIIEKKEVYAKENGVKVEAKIIDIYEHDNPLHNRYKKDRKIEEITVQYIYKNKTYTSKTTTIPNKHIDINDIIEEAYVLDDNPDEVIIIAFTNDIISVVIIPILGVLFILGVICIILAIKNIKLYKNAFENFATITAEYIGVENRGSSYYIICRSNQINGIDMEFKSHSYNAAYLEKEIEKRNIKQFEIKYNPNNLKQYIMDTNKIDKVMYS